MEIQSLKLVYFSPTGTTKTIIQGIARRFNQDHVEEIDVTKPEARKKQLQASENELLVVGVPVYGGRVPAVAIDWLRTIKANRTPAVCVVVYGNREFDDALLELKDTLVECNCVPIACAAFIGEHSFSSAEIPIAAARPDMNDINHAELFGEKVKQKLLSIESIVHVSELTVPGNYPHREFKGWVIDFIAVDEQCLQCGVCAQGCPVGAIDLENSALIDQEKCVLCCACIKSCPENARTVKTGTIKDLALRLSQMCQKRKEPKFFF